MLIVVDNLAIMNENIKDLQKGQREIYQLLQTSGVVQEGIGAHQLKFDDKYDIVLPFKEFIDFSMFDRKLSENEECSKDFVSLLLNLF